MTDDLSNPILGNFSEVNLIVRSERPAAALTGEVSAAMRRLDPELAISNAQPVSEIVDDSVKARRFSTTILTLFAVVALVLATLGIYGVLANVVSQQTREIGLRLALGATPSSVLWMVLRQALVLTTVGIPVGLGGATALTRLMSSMLYEIQPHDATAFIGACVGLAVMVLSASLIPAWRATRVDPIEALRTE